LELQYALQDLWENKEFKLILGAATAESKRLHMPPNISKAAMAEVKEEKIEKDVIDKVRSKVGAEKITKVYSYSNY
jgi:hypothetical protein